MSHHVSLGQKLMRGFIGGVLATLPMTVWMLSANRTLPAIKPDPLPPEEITKNLIDKADLDQELSETQKKEASLFNHFLYGGLVAVPFGLFSQNTRSGSAVKQGVLYGLFVWFGNYLGLLPVARVYPPATREPARMNTIMIIAHVCWGGSLGWMTDRFSESRKVPVSSE